MRVQTLDEGQVVVRLDYRVLPDLDMLMLDIWQYLDDGRDDDPTSFAVTGEPAWQWAKISPCYCGEHGWHWDARSAESWPKRQIEAGLVEGEPDMIVDRPRGRFIAMEWSR